MEESTVFGETTEKILNSTTDISLATGYAKISTLFWSMVGFYFVIALLTIIGNGVVVYAAYGNENSGPLRYLDNVVKSLAMSDILYGLIGTPLLLYSYYLGKIQAYSNQHNNVTYVD